MGEPVTRGNKSVLRHIFITINKVQPIFKGRTIIVSGVSLKKKQWTRIPAENMDNTKLIPGSGTGENYKGLLSY